MCGIIAGVTPAYFEAQRIRDALDALHHRGPDDSGWLLEPPAFLGNRRLSIIDTAGGRQPIYNEDRSMAVVLNGEIYNFKDLRKELEGKGHRFSCHTDTEVLVHGYEEWGRKLPEKLRGMFAFAVWDSKRNEMFLARDRFGKKPLYYTGSERQGFLFGSEIKAVRKLAADLGESWTLRPQSIYDYLSLGSVPQPHTIYEEVKMVPQGCWALVRDSALRIERYWSPSPAQKLQISYPEALERVRAHLSEAVRLRLQSDVPLGVYLSSGIDSSIVAYEAARQTGEKLQTFTVGVEDNALNEAPIAARTARALGVQNTLISLQINPLELFEKVVPHFDQPFADASAIPSYAVSLRAREYVTVVLNGDGGDEVFGGYRRYVAARLSDRLPMLKLAAKCGAEKALERMSRQRRDVTGFLRRLVRGVSQPAGEKYLTWTTDSLFEKEKRPVWRDGVTMPTESWIEGLVNEPLSEMRALMLRDQYVILPGLLVKMDMATMLASVEARSPFLDHHVAEFAASLPDQFLVRGLRSKAILRDAYRGLLPEEVIRAPKGGFEIPLDRWLNTSLKSLLHDLLGASDSRVSEFIERSFVQKLLEGKILQERNRSYILYPLLVLELWLRNAAAPKAAIRETLRAA